jgi:hypothetical protein
MKWFRKSIERRSKMRIPEFLSPLQKEYYLEYSFYDLPEEEQKRWVEKNIDQKDIQRLKEIAQSAGTRKGKRYSAREMGEAFYILDILGEKWETQPEKEIKKALEETEKESHKRQEDLVKFRTYQEAEKIPIPAQDMKEYLEKESDRWEKQHGTDAYMFRDFRLLRSDIEKIDQIKELKKDVQRLEKEIAQEEDEKQRQLLGKDKQLKEKEYLSKEKKIFEKYKNPLKEYFKNKATEEEKEIEKLFPQSDDLRKGKGKVAIKKIPKLHGVIKNAFIESGRIDIAFGDNPVELMKHIRKMHDRGADITKIRPEVWLDRHAVLATSKVQVLTLFQKGSKEATFNFNQTLRENPEILLGTTKEEAPRKAPSWFGTEQWPVFYEDFKKEEKYPTWGEVGGIAKFPFNSALSVNPELHIEGLYKNTKFKDREKLQKLFKKTLGKLKAEDINGWDAGCFNIKWIRKPTFNEKTGRYNKDGIIDPNCTFYLFTRFLDPGQIGRKEITKSIFASGKPEIYNLIIKHQNYFENKDTRNRIDRMEKYVTEKEQFSPEEQWVIKILKEERGLLVKEEMGKKEIEEIKTKKEEVERELDERFKDKGIDVSSWSFDKKLLEDFVLEEKGRTGKTPDQIKEGKIAEYARKERLRREKLTPDERKVIEILAKRAVKTRMEAKERTEEERKEDIKNLEKWLEKELQKRKIDYRDWDIARKYFEWYWRAKVEEGEKETKEEVIEGLKDLEKPRIKPKKPEVKPKEEKPPTEEEKVRIEVEMRQKEEERKQKTEQELKEAEERFRRETNKIIKDIDERIKEIDDIVSRTKEKRREEEEKIRKEKVKKETERKAKKEKPKKSLEEMIRKATPEEIEKAREAKRKEQRKRRR